MFCHVDALGRAVREALTQVRRNSLNRAFNRFQKQLARTED